MIRKRFTPGFRRTSIYEQMLAQQVQMGAAVAEVLKGTPMYAAPMMLWDVHTVENFDGPNRPRPTYDPPRRPHVDLPFPRTDLIRE